MINRKGLMDVSNGLHLSSNAGSVYNLTDHISKLTDRVPPTPRHARFNYTDRKDAYHTGLSHILVFSDLDCPSWTDEPSISLRSESIFFAVNAPRILTMQCLRF